LISCHVDSLLDLKGWIKTARLATSGLGRTITNIDAVDALFDYALKRLKLSDGGQNTCGSQSAWLEFNEVKQVHMRNLGHHSHPSGYF
jgi:hypothetical protein